MDNQYVEPRDGGYWIAGTRISLDSVVYAFRDGLSPETIQREYFPLLSLEQVYGAVTYYLAHRAEIDTYLEQAKSEYESLRQTSQQADPEFYQKLANTRQQMQTTK
jgi:uncharacterized protein (DUF433 family)